MEATKDWFAHVGSVLASMMFVWAMFRQYFPCELREYFEKHSKRLVVFFYPYIQVTFHEFTGDRFMRSDAYLAIENYLSSRSSTEAKRLKADIVKNNNQSLVLSMDDYEEVSDEFQGVRLRWNSGKTAMKSQATAIKVRNRMRKLYTNNCSRWSHVTFQHPATFQTLAMEAEKKQEIMEDLITFSKAEDFYARIGRAWKRGYLLYGPPGTGKSTMIAAMANLLGYDLYDLELTSVRDNTELRRLLIETTSKSVIVIEDIDCSLDLTGQRRKKKEKEEEGNSTEKDPRQKLEKEERETRSSQVTLSGLLNFIDGIWSACGGERLIVFTTNHIEKLDPALIRKGRMDKHIELSYCSFEAFKVLAKNYLSIDSHDLFATVSELLRETKLTPADVAEHLMPKKFPPDVEFSLRSLIQALEVAKEEAKLKAVKEAEEKEEELTGEPGFVTLEVK
ncbi:hypothetical protein Patl1_22075 [Pistacia atlantica]|uniref:Uncharacterized protein n=1 Tax=Pistacia atlantica TaxID=434234 RepID=A0ACC1BM54_9ROSI|nr:hypothetical protein Patl1_22075 [Pistacia atlantica]